MSNVTKLVRGVTAFRRDAFPVRERLFRELAEGQTPHTLFVTCSDSRIDPSLRRTEHGVSTANRERKQGVTAMSLAALGAKPLALRSRRIDSGQSARAAPMGPMPAAARTGDVRQLAP